MSGTLSILNVGAGDTKLSFDPARPDEVARASAIVSDMMRRGFVILVEAGTDDKGPLYRRVKAFDATTAEYIVAGSGIDILEPVNVSEQKAATRQYRARKTKREPTRIPAAKAKAVAVSRSAGG